MTVVVVGAIAISLHDSIGTMLFKSSLKMELRQSCLEIGVCSHYPVLHRQTQRAILAIGCLYVDNYCRSIQLGGQHSV
jgi:hypothetical protein